MRRPGADSSVVAVTWGNAHRAKGGGHPRRNQRANGRPEEPIGFDGRRQPSVGGTSRMNREVHVRFCERLGVKFPGPTRPMISCCWMPEAANPVRDARRGSGWTSSEVKRQLCSGQKVTI